MEYTIWVTNNCNMQCKYCYVDEMKGQQYFRNEDIDLLINFIKSTSWAAEEIKINFFGGEPLLNFEFIELVILKLEKEVSLKIKYYITTNGLLLTKEHINYFKAQNVVLSLSWDGNEKANDSNRVDISGIGTYRVIREKYNLLKKCGLRNVRVRATFNCNTLKYLKESIASFLEIDRDMSVIFVPDYFDPEWNQKNINELQKIIDELDNIEPCNITVIGDRQLRKCVCGGGINNYHIYTDGAIYPCSFVVNKKQFCIGNIFAGIDKKKIASLSVNYDKPIEICRGCDYEKCCLTYKCRYLNWALTGDFNQAAPIVCLLENIKMCSNIKK